MSGSEARPFAAHDTSNLPSRLVTCRQLYYAPDLKRMRSQMSRRLFVGCLTGQFGRTVRPPFLRGIPLPPKHTYASHNARPRWPGVHLYLARGIVRGDIVMKRVIF